jgi:hypothetical protein
MVKKILVLLFMGGLFVNLSKPVAAQTKTVPSSHCCVTEFFTYFMDKNPDNIRKRFGLYKSIGTDIIRTHFFWNEPSDGAEFDLSPYKLYYETLAKETDFRIKMILCVFQAPTGWFLDSHPDAQLTDQNGAKARNVISFWYPDLDKVLDDKTGRMFKYFEQLGIMDRIDYVIPDLGPAGEPIYPHTWTTGLTEQTFWCYDENAHKHFRSTMKIKYKDINKANKTWGTQFKTWDDVIVLKPKTQPGEYWKDVLLWYRDSKRDFIRRRIDCVNRYLSKYPGKKTLVYVPGWHSTQQEWDDAVASGDGNVTIKIMCDTEFLIDVSHEKGCWIQYTGCENFAESAYITKYVKDHGYTGMEVWGENAGYAEIAQDPVNLGEIIIKYGMFGLDLTLSHFLFEHEDGLTPNKAFPKLGVAFDMIKTYWQDLGAYVTPVKDVTKSVLEPVNVSQEYTLGLVNRKNNDLQVKVKVDNVDGFATKLDTTDIVVKKGQKQEVKVKLEALNIVKIPQNNVIPVKVTVESEGLKNSLVFNRNIILFQRKKVDCVKLDKTVLDGDLADWQTSENIAIDSTSLDSYGKVSDDKENPVIGVVYAGYDRDNLYFAAKVTNKNMIGKYKDDAIWQGDCVELWIDTINQSDEKHNMPDDPAKYQIVAAPMTDNKPVPGLYVYRNPDQAVSKSLISSVKTVSKILSENGQNTGYILEMAVPISKLAGLGEVKPGKTIGFNVSVCYRDKTDNWRDKIWSGANKPDSGTWGCLVFR